MESVTSKTTTGCIIFLCALLMATSAAGAQRVNSGAGSSTGRVQPPSPPPPSPARRRTNSAPTAPPRPPQPPLWSGKNHQDLRKEYSNIFRSRNRNAASHLWSSFILDRSEQFTEAMFVDLFTGFCAISGSPVRPGDHNRYRLELPNVPRRGTPGGGGSEEGDFDSRGGERGETGMAVVDTNGSTTAVATITTEGAGRFQNRPSAGTSRGYMHYCCWPCVCDTQDFIRVDTKTVRLKDGQEKQFHFAVIGNPCVREEMMDERFVQPFYGGRETTIKREAPEVRCDAEGQLIGATLSDNGYIIISMFFDAVQGTASSSSSSRNDGGPLPLPSPTPTPSSVSSSSSKSAEVAVVVPRGGGGGGPVATLLPLVDRPHHDESYFEAMCTNRANKGYNSGMGEIFRKVAGINPISY